MNEIKAQEYLQWIAGKQAFLKPMSEHSLIALAELDMLDEARLKFLSLMTKDYEHGEHGV